MKEPVDRPERVTRFEDSADPGSEAPRKSLITRILLAGPRFLSRRLTLIVLGAALLGVLTYLVLSADSLFRSNELEREKLKIEAEIEMYNDENRILEMQIERSKNDPAYIEDEARKKLRLVRPGETVYRLSEEPDLSDEPPPEPPVIP